MSTSDLIAIRTDYRATPGSEPMPIYVVKCGGGCSTISFAHAERLRQAVMAWIGEAADPMETGTEAHYAAYREAMRRGREHAQRTGARCPAELTPQLVGLEGRRVEVTERDGRRRRFHVGRSTGWMPVHLEIATRRSSGGPAACIAKDARVRLVA